MKARNRILTKPKPSPPIPPPGDGRDADGRFLPGVSGNPRGRPLGSHNHTSQLLEELLNERAEALANKTIEIALDGDARALRMCLDRLLPARRERHLVLELPPPATPADISAGFARVVEALTHGDLTPSETNSVAALLENARRAMETTELARRIHELENQVAPGGRNGAEKSS